MGRGDASTGTPQTAGKKLVRRNSFPHQPEEPPMDASSFFNAPVVFTHASRYSAILEDRDDSDAIGSAASVQGPAGVEDQETQEALVREVAVDVSEAEERVAAEKKAREQQEALVRAATAREAEERVAAEKEAREQQEALARAAAAREAEERMAAGKKAREQLDENGRVDLRFEEEDKDEEEEEEFIESMENRDEKQQLPATTDEDGQANEHKAVVSESASSCPASSPLEHRSRQPLVSPSSSESRQMAPLSPASAYAAGTASYTHHRGFAMQGRYISSAPDIPVHVKAILRMRCQTSGSDYAIHWTRSEDGSNLVMSSGYVTTGTGDGAVCDEQLQAGGAAETFADACVRVTLPTTGDNAVARAFAGRQMVLLQDGFVDQGFARAELAQAHGIKSICFMPALDGVIEYGSAKSSWQHDEAARNACLPVDETAAAFESRAAYAIFWTQHGDEFAVAADYDAIQQASASATLSDALASTSSSKKTFVTESRALRFPAQQDSVVAAVARHGRSEVLTSPSENPNFKRSALAREFGLTNVCCVPCAGGVLEYGIVRASELEYGAVPNAGNALSADSDACGVCSSKATNPAHQDGSLAKQASVRSVASVRFVSNPPPDEGASTSGLRCQECDEDDAIKRCTICDLLLCQDCTAAHQKSKRTKGHSSSLQDVDPGRQAAASARQLLRVASIRDVCQECEDGAQAMTQCASCNILLCEGCTKTHKKSMRTRDHPLTLIPRLLKTISQLEPPEDGTYTLKGKSSASNDPYGLLESDGAGMGDMDGKVKSGVKLAGSK